jgi:hypothetical protein
LYIRMGRLVPRSFLPVHRNSPQRSSRSSDTLPSLAFRESSGAAHT